MEPTTANKPGPAAGVKNPFAGAKSGPRMPNGGNASVSGSGGDVEMELDFSDVTNEFPLIDEGIHPAKLIGFERVPSKSSSNENLEWEVRILSGKFKNATLKFWTSLAPAARWKIVQSLEAFGIDAAGQVVKFKPSDLLGKPLDVEIYHDEYADPKSNRVRTTSKIERFYPPSEETMRLFQADSPIPKAPG